MFIVFILNNVIFWINKTAESGYTDANLKILLFLFTQRQIKTHGRIKLQTQGFGSHMFYRQ